MKPDQYCYPAILTYEQGQISITFPDLPGCTSSAATDDEALACAREALGGHLSVMEDFDDPIPAPSRLADVALEDGERSTLVSAFMPIYRSAVDTKAVSKTITLPRYMARWIEENGVKLSPVTQEAIRSLMESSNQRPL